MERLDASHKDDRCRVRHSNSMMVFAGVRRLANSLFMEWRQQFPKPKPDHKTATVSLAYFCEDHRRRSIRFLCAKRPHLEFAS